MNIWIVLITFFFIILLFYFFDFYRFFHICFCNEMMDSIKNYSKVKRIKNCSSKIIVSLSCRPNEEYKLKPVLLSLLNQTIKIDQISINIPHVSNDNKQYSIPKEYEDVAIIHNCGVDHGKNNNIIHTLYREGEYGTIIIGLDENYIYGKTFLEELLKVSLNNNNYAIIFPEGMLVKPEFFQKEIIYADKINNIKKFIKAKTMNFHYLKNYRIII